MEKAKRNKLFENAKPARKIFPPEADDFSNEDPRAHMFTTRFGNK